MSTKQIAIAAAIATLLAAAGAWYTLTPTTAERVAKCERLYEKDNITGDEQNCEKAEAEGKLTRSGGIN